MKAAPGGSDVSSRTRLRVLMVEDSEDDERLLLRELEKGGYEPDPERVDTAEAMRQALAEGQPWDVIISDWRMPRFSAPEALEVLRETGSEAPFIIVSGKVGEEEAVEAMRCGAHDYVMKDNLARLGAAVERGLREARIREERRRAEESLKVSEARFRSLVMNSSDMITVFAPDGTRLYASPSIEPVLGYKPEETLGGSAFDLVHPDDVPSVREEFAERARTPGTGPPFEFRLRHADGSWHTFESIGTNLLDDPSVGGLVFNARDVTDRKRTEEALRESEERYRRLVELSPDFIGVHGKGRVLFTNRAGAKLFGAGSPEELTGRRVMDLIHPDYRETVTERISRTEEERERTELIQEKFLRLDGRAVDVEAVSTPIVYRGEEATLVVARDITTRKRAEEERDRLFEFSLDLLGIVGLDGYFKRVNPAFEDILGYSGEELLARPFIEFVHPDDRAATVREFETLSGGLRTAYFENRYLRKDGSQVWLEWKAVPAVDEDLIYANARDVTERKRAEEALRRRDAILRAVAFAAERFLERVASWEESAPEVLERLGLAAEVSRVYVFENYLSEDGEVWSTQRYEWAAPGVPSQMDNPLLKAFPYRAAGYGRWARLMGRGEPVHGRTREFPENEQRELKEQDILSIAIMPILVGGGWWGTIGLDDCLAEREWSAAEIEALKAAAGTLGAAIQRERAEEAIGQSEQLYRTVVEQATEYISLVDVETRRFVGSNPAFREALGYTEEELGRMTLYDIVAHDRESIEENARRVVQKGRHFLGERKHRRKDGTLVDVEVSASVVLHGGREVACIVGRDVTERVEAFRLLEERVTALARISSSLTVGQRIEATLDALATRIVQSTAALACAVVLMDEETGLLRTAGSHGLPEGYTAALEAAYRGGMRPPPVEVLRTHRPLLVRGAREAALNTPFSSPLHGFLNEAPWDTVYFMPLVSRGQALGVLNLYYLPGEEPGEDEIVFLRAVADQTSVAVENAGLFAAVQGKAALEERQRLARELHDSVSQALYGIALGARTARALLGREVPTDSVDEWLEYVLSLAEAGLTEMRALIFELRPESLETEGLVAALEQQAAALEARHEIPVHTTLGEEPNLSLETKEALYRIVQEAMHNIVKHARASRADLRLGREARGIALEVSDDGVGFDPEGAFSGRLGLKSMRERATRLGGTLSVESAPGEGTSIRVRFPPST
jgi:PAS domain S-box-containing protein